MAKIWRLECADEVRHLFTPKHSRFCDQLLPPRHDEGHAIIAADEAVEHDPETDLVAAVAAILDHVVHLCRIHPPRRLARDDLYRLCHVDIPVAPAARGTPVAGVARRLGEPSAHHP